MKHKFTHSIEIDDTIYRKTVTTDVTKEQFKKELAKELKMTYEEFVEKETKRLLDRDKHVKFYESYIKDKLEAIEIKGFGGDPTGQFMPVKGYLVTNPIQTRVDFTLDLVQLNPDNSIKLFRVDILIPELARQLRDNKKLTWPVLEKKSAEFKDVKTLKNDLDFTYDKLDNGKVTNIKMKHYGNVLSIDHLGEKLVSIRTINVDCSYILQTYRVLYDLKDKTFVDVNSMMLTPGTLEHLAEWRDKTIEIVKIQQKNKPKEEKKKEELN